tara:strand:- start:189 stop:371 length:183 start_codon:yes stop_codon:yes gene_type:complete
MSVGNLVKYRKLEGFWMPTNIVGIVTKVTKLSVYVKWSDQAGITGYNLKDVMEILEVIDG